MVGFNESKWFNSEQVKIFLLRMWSVGLKHFFYSIFCNFLINNKCVEYNYRVYVSYSYFLVK